MFDSEAGVTQTLHLDGSATGFRYPFPQAGKTLVPRGEDRYEVWDVPPRRSHTVALVRWRH